MLVAVSPPVSVIVTWKLYVPTLVKVAVVVFAALVPLALKGYVRRDRVIPYVMGANIATWIDTLFAALLPDPVLRFLAEQLRGNVRELEGALHSVQHYGRVAGRPVGMAGMAAISSWNRVSATTLWCTSVSTLNTKRSADATAKVRTARDAKAKTFC